MSQTAGNATGNYPINRYLNVRSAYFPSFSSDGSRIAFLSDITGIPQIWQVGLSANSHEIHWPDQATFTADRVMGVWHSPAPSDTRLIYSHDRGGNENAQLFLLSADGATDTPLTTGYESAMHLFGQWSPSGDRILFAANRRDPALFDLYVQPINGEARLVWQNDRPGYLFHTVFSPDGKHAVAVRTFSSFSSDLIEIDLTSGEARAISSQDQEALYESAHYALDGKSIYTNTNLGSEFLYVAQLNLDTLAMEPVVAPEWDVDVIALSPDGRYLAYEVNVDGDSDLHLLELATGSTRRATSLGLSPGVVGMMDTLLTFSLDSKQLAFSYMAATRASDIYVWDLDANQMRAVTRSSHGGLPADSFVAPELIHFPTFDNDGDGKRHIPAWLFKPKSDEPVPAVLIVHGGPEAQYRPYFHFLAQYFLQNGYAVLAPNVRGSTGYGKAYSHLDDVRKRMDSVADLAHAAYWLKQQPGIDGNRLVVYGGSYGGFMVLAAVTSYPDLWAAAVDIVGISNFVTFLENTSPYRRPHREAEYGSLDQDRDFLQDISPLTHADKIVAPLMVIHGANDPRVPLGEAEQLVQLLRQRNIPVEFLIFDDEGHGVVKLKNKLVAYPAILDFLSTHLSK